MSTLKVNAAANKPANEKKSEPGVTVNVGNKSLSFAVADLLIEATADGLFELCHNAKLDPAFKVNNLLAWPDDARWALFELIIGIERRFCLTTEAGGKPFKSLVDLIVHHGRPELSIEKTERLKRAAIEAVNLEHPDALETACRSIHDRLQRKGVKLGLPQSFLKQARELHGAEAKVNALDAARRFHEHVRQANELEGDLHAIRYFDDDFFVWRGSYWCRCHDKQFAAQFVAFLQMDPDYADHLTGRFVGNVVANLKGQTLLNCWGQPMPLWIKSEEPLRAVRSPFISFQNGRINITSAINKEEPARLREHDPRHFSEVVLPYDYDPSAACPLWLETLGTSLAKVSDQDRRIDVFQEMCGWALVHGDLRFEKFFVLVGDGGNGKSTALRTVEQALGASNVSHVPIDQLNGEFRVVDMMGKLANIAYDMSQIDKVAEGRLKELVSGDPIQINRKNKAVLTMVPTAKLIFACNHLPQFTDRTEGTWRRLMVIPFLNSFRDRAADERRGTRLLAELPGIFNWMLDGVKRLYRQRSFTACDVCSEWAQKHRFDSDPFQQFCDACVALERGASVTKEALYSKYRNYCEDNGRKTQGSTHFFEQVLKLEGVSECRPGSGGRRPRGFVGIRLGQPAELRPSPCRPSKNRSLQRRRSAS